MSHKMKNSNNSRGTTISNPASGTTDATKTDPPGEEAKRLRGRRRLIKGLAGGGGLVVTGAYLPDTWSSPVVQSVLLPAHASTSPPATPVMSCSIEICEGTGGEGPCQTFTSNGTTDLGCGDGNVDVGGENGPNNYPNICSTVTQDGVGIPGLTVQLDVTRNGVFGGGGYTGTDQVVTDSNGVACNFDFGGGNDIFQISDGDSAEFCFTVLNRSDIAPCCITITWTCD